MVLKGYRLWVMGQLDSNVQSPTAGASSTAFSAASSCPAATAAAAAAALAVGK
jgi:hypothetical protein